MYEVYRNGGRIYINSETKIEYPSVTTITSLKSPFKGKPGNSAKVGTLIHHTILSQYATGILPPPKVQIWGLPQSEVEDRIQRALTMWRNLEGFDFLFDSVETLIVNDEYGYAGRADGIGSTPDAEVAVMDIKTGDFYDSYPMQGAAYAKATGATDCYFVQLDVSLARNPDQRGVVHHMGSQAIEEAFIEFKRLLDVFYASQDLNTKATKA